MQILCMTVFILGLISGVFMETCPSEEEMFPCSCMDGWGDIEIECFGPLDLKTLRQIFSRLSGKNNVHLKLDNVELGKLASNFFYGIGIKRLEFYDCKLHSLTNDSQPGLLGLENYLEELNIVSSFTEDNAPTNLKFGHLKKLKTLELLNTEFSEVTSITEISDDWFSSGPLSLETLVIINNRVEKIGSNAFSKLNNLKELSLVANKFDLIERSMLPPIADKLETLDLSYNGLTDIPEDIFSRMPSISKINLSYNYFTTLDERTWTPIWQHLHELRLEGNNIYCNSQLKWTFRSRIRPYVFGECSAPKEVKGQSLKKFFESISG